MISREEAKAIINRLSECVEHDSCEKVDCAYFIDNDSLKSLLEYVENAEIVVRCIDCKWLQDGSPRECKMNKNKQTFDIFYCFAGEKKEEGA